MAYDIYTETRAPKQTIKRGMKNKGVKSVQEWLNLRGVKCGIDGDFGPATEAAVKQYQERMIAQGKVVPANTKGTVPAATWESLVAPMALCLHNPIKDNIADFPNITLRAAAYLFAVRYLEVGSPREVGGQNRGPWVRLFTGGHEGNSWPWCAAFVTFILKRACEATGKPMPIVGSAGCDELAKQAKKADRFIPVGKKNPDIVPGDIFLLVSASNPNDYIHTGFVMSKPVNGVIRTLEGNTNDEGSREGYEVARRIRNIRKLAFIKVG